MRYEITLKGQGSAKEIAEQLKELAESIEEMDGTPQLDGWECSEEDGYPLSYLIQST